MVSHFLTTMSVLIDTNNDPFASDEEDVDIPISPPANPRHAWNENGGLAIPLETMTTVERGDTSDLPLMKAVITEAMYNDDESWGQFIGALSYLSLSPLYVLTPLTPSYFSRKPLTPWEYVMSTQLSYKKPSG